VKKIISILVALGVVLGLTVMATPVMAAPVTNLNVTLTVNVACNVSCYNITFNCTNGISAGQWIRVEFPAGTDLTGLGAVTVNGGGTVVNPFGLTGLDVKHQIAAGIPAGAGVEVYICGVANPPAGPHVVTVWTETDTTPVTAAFTILAGASISPTSVTWCPCHNVSTNITWGASGNIVSINGFVPADWAMDATNTTLSINCSAITAYVGANTTCSQIPLQIGFDLGCNATLMITVTDNATIPLATGWNLISLPLIPITGDPETFEAPITDVLAPVLANVVSVWYYDGCTDQWGAYNNGPGPVEDFGLTTMGTGKAYWVCMNTTTTLNMCGFKLPCPPAGPPCYCYCHCWNMVGYHAVTSMNLSDYTANLSPAGSLFGCLTYNSSGWATVYPGTSMVPGLGYWMAFTADQACFAPPV